MSELKPLPSELVEPYVEKAFGTIIEGIATGFITPQSAKHMIRGIDWLVDTMSGVHGRLAVSNARFMFENISDDELVKICKQVFKEVYQ